jgi:hypothetical protein
LLKQFRTYLNRPYKQSPVDFLFIAFFVAGTVIVGEMKKVTQWEVMKLVLLFALKAFLVLFLGTLILAMVWMVINYLYSSLKKDGSDKVGTRSKKMTLKDLLLMPVLFPFVLLWIVSLWVQDLLLSKRWPGSGFKYIKVNDDGTARELTKDECNYLMEEFDPGDGARPYVKFGYDEKTPDGRLGGFLKRRHLPSDIVIGPAEREKS